MSRLNILSFALFFLLIAFVSGQCYSYAGVEMDSSYMPCNGSAEVSMCCHLGFSNNGGDKCGSGSTYGLCGITGTQLWRESCTDPTWQSPTCLRLCLGVNDTAITACSNGSYCCGKNAADCCSSGQGKFIVNNQVADSSESSAISNVASSISISPTSISISTSSQPSVIISTVYRSTPSTTAINSSAKSSQGISTGAKVGIAVGVSLVILSLLGFAALFWKRKYSRNKGAVELDSKEHIVQLDMGPKYVYRAEADASPKPIEMGYGRGDPAELL